MAEPRPRVSLFRYGAPGPYVVSVLIAGLLWLPIRLWERDGSVPAAVVEAGLNAVIWGFAFYFTLSRFGKPRPAEADRAADWAVTEAALRRGEPPADEAERAAVADNLPAIRRGALFGAAGGVVLLGPLIVLAIRGGWELAAVGFGIVLVAVLAEAVRTGRRERRLRAALTPVQGG
ncbi:hypothetical protein J5U46_26570 [Micromonospora tulbaghiae]|uniref:Uncharacterized protein n=1 Tax=Micromonospora tulbaghiae TaxID=479978 RepID=A0AAW4JUH2_9ACTN|nr:hypothetical protein [Micromonospora tulbaghiae]MBO4143715.1 hypothetical protein [Micromonospora tulbaghiae]MDX5457997.1 hypothetical protein [Micromonospora tulbaghiae]SCE84561.1 hypothetical protein GA0070562_3355 [Micromonospora tulbaghiae]